MSNLISQALCHSCGSRFVDENGCEDCGAWPLTSEQREVWEQETRVWAELERQAMEEMLPCNVCKQPARTECHYCTLPLCDACQDSDGCACDGGDERRTGGGRTHGCAVEGRRRHILALGYASGGGNEHEVL